VWSEHRFIASVSWETGPLPEGQPVRIYSHPETGDPIVLSGSAERLGRLQAPLNPRRVGLARTTVREDRQSVLISYLGPEDLWVQ
jgi:hypothetical protein